MQQTKKDMKTPPPIFKQNISIFILVAFFLVNCAPAQESHRDSELDRKVKAFLDGMKGKWQDLNIPTSDGQLLYDIILKNRYTQGLDIGTSTGHSAIWIAWAFSKTGGKLITIEIDESRHKEAISNFEKAGLSDYIDSRLADAHDLVKELEGPFDFVFSDADKGWYVNYFKDVSPKLEVGGCFAAHNVRPASLFQRGMPGTREYLEYVQGLDNYSTTVDNSGGGVAISYKK